MNEFVVKFLWIRLLIKTSHCNLWNSGKDGCCIKWRFFLFKSFKMTPFKIEHNPTNLSRIAYHKNFYLLFPIYIYIFVVVVKIYLTFKNTSLFELSAWDINYSWSIQQFTKKLLKYLPNLLNIVLFIDTE